MNSRRITLAIGAATGGALASAFLSTGVAFAAPSTDIFIDVVSPTQPEQVTAIDGIPPFYQEVSGTQLFDINDSTLATTTGTGSSAVTVPDTIGTFTAEQSVFTTPSSIGFDNTEEVITNVSAINPLPTADGTVPTADIPTVGSTYDTATFDGFVNHYSDIVTAAVGTTPASDTVTDTLTLPAYLGGSTIDLTPYVSGFDASAGLAGDQFGPFATDLAATAVVDAVGRPDLAGLFLP